MIKRYMLASACQFVIGGYWVHHETLNQRSEIPCFDGWDQHADGNFFFWSTKKIWKHKPTYTYGSAESQIAFSFKKIQIAIASTRSCTESHPMVILSSYFYWMDPIREAFEVSYRQHKRTTETIIWLRTYIMLRPDVIFVNSQAFSSSSLSFSHLSKL